MLLDGKLALVTGGGSGIGEGIARAMAEDGARAIVADKDAIGARRVALSIELSPQGARVNAIAPGMIATSLTADARQNLNHMANFHQRIPLGRLVEPADIAGPAELLASNPARYVTGAMLPVDGGFLAN
jgi:meso-butanediol dehydrogenase / (S,S)-butanediol dehydrogenase / diacetyl reductase